MRQHFVANFIVVQRQQKKYKSYEKQQNYTRKEENGHKERKFKKDGKGTVKEDITGGWRELKSRKKLQNEGHKKEGKEKRTQRKY